MWAFVNEQGINKLWPNKEILKLIFMFHSVKLIAHQNSDNEPGSEHILVKILCDLFTLTSSLTSNKKESSC